MPKISIIVPIYNSENYIKSCLECLINQTLKDIEIILVDDGSVDNSARICDEYALKDERIRVIHKNNEGQGVARNIGISVAKGDFIGFIDSDDKITIDFYEKLYNYAKQYDTDIACGNIVKLFPNGKEEIYGLRLYLKSQLTLLDSIEQKKFLIYTDLFYDKIVKRELFSKYDIRFNEKGIFEDTPVGLNITLAAKNAVFVPDVKYYYIQQKKSTMHNMSDKTFAMFDLFDKMHEQIYQKFKNIENFELYQKFLYMRDFRQLFFFIFATDKKERNKFLKQAQKYLKENNNFYDKTYSNFDINAKCFIIRYSPKAFVFMFCAYIYYFWDKILKQKLKKRGIL